MRHLFIALLLCLGGWSSWLAAADFDYALQPQAVARDVYVFIGRTEDFDRENGGNIVNTGFIVGTDGVIVIDTGPSRRYGEQMRQAIARVSPLPIALVINTHHHPDHFLGNQAFSDVSIGALAATRQGILGEGNAFAENLYRLSGDWMKGTEVAVPTRVLAAGELVAGGRRLQLLAMDGHTGADLVVVDTASGVMFTGDLAFNERAPTTPHADVAHWLEALSMIEARAQQHGMSVLVPGHGGVTRDLSPLRRTRAWLQWLNGTLQMAAREGLDMNDLLARPLPPEFAGLPLAASEYRRSVSHLYPAMEVDALREAH